MADNGDSFSIDFGKIATSVVKEITGNVKVDAKDAIKTIKEVMSLCEDLSASKYLGDEKTLINGLTNAYKEFGKAKNKANATDLIGYANALKASSKNYDSVIGGLKGFEDRLDQANKKSSEAARVLNEDLFNRLNDLRNGLGMTEKDFLSFTKALESSSGFERLKKELESSKKKIKELKDALDNALNNPRTQELENKLKNIEKQLSQVQGRAKTELAVGLSAMGFSDDQINKDFAKYFDDINRGAATASSALAQIKKELGMVDQEAASSTAVDKLGGDIAELKVNLDSAFDGLEKSFSEIKNEFDKLSDKISKDITKIFNSTKNTTGKSITPKQISNMVDTITNIGEVDTNKLDSVSNALKSVASLSGKQLDGGIAKTTKELCSSFNSFKQQNISGLIDLLKQISSVSGKKIDSSVANGVYRLAGATKIVNPKGVEALSKLDIKKMNNVTVDSSIMNISAMLSSIKGKNIQEIVNGINKLNPSKISGVVIDPSIKNLSYLSSISGKDFSGLKQMNGLNFDWLNNPNINDKKAKALSNIANALEKISKNKNVVKGISTAVASSGSGILNGQNAVSAKSNITFTPPTGASSDVKQALVDLGATKNAADLFAKKITKAGFEIDKVKTTFEKVKDGAKTLTKVVVSASNAIGGTLSTTALINSDTGEIDRTTWNVTNSVKDQMISMQDAYSTIQKMYSVLSRAKDLSGTKAFTDVESALSTFRNLLNGANGDVDQLNLSIISMGQTGASYIKNMSDLVSKLDINISEHIMNNGSKKMSITDIISVRDKMDSVLNSASKFRFDANVNTDATALYDKLKNIIKAIKSIEQGTNIEDAITGAFGKNSTSNGVLGDIEKIIIRIGNRIADIKGNTVFDDSKLTTFLKSASSTAKNKNVDRSSDEHKSLIEDLKTLEKAYSEAGYSAVKMYEDMEKNGTPAYEVIDRITKSAAVLNQQIRSTDVDKIIPDTAKFQTYENSLFALRNKTENAVRNWTAAKYGKSEADYDKLVKSLRAINTLDNNLRGGLLSEEGFLKQRAELTRDVSSSLYTIRQNGENTLGLFNRIQKVAKNFSYWFSTTSIVMGAVNQVRKMVDAVTKLDSAMTELRKVTDETEASYSRFLRDATARAKNMGATVVDTVTATADFARLGYSINEAEDFADAAIIYKNVGDGIESITDASESIIATMQAFDGEIEDVMDIVDKFNNVGNNYAISSKGVGDALLRSAAAMKAANNTIDQTIALATAANEIVQDPDKVGMVMPISVVIRCLKRAISVKGWGQSRPRKDFVMCVLQS